MIESFRSVPLSWLHDGKKRRTAINRHRRTDSSCGPSGELLPLAHQELEARSSHQS